MRGIGKKRFLIKVNKPSRCHNPQKAWTPQRPFRGKRLKPELHTNLSEILGSLNRD